MGVEKFLRRTKTRLVEKITNNIILTIYYF